MAIGRREHMDLDKSRAPLEHVDGTVEGRVLTLLFDGAAGVGDRGSVAFEDQSDFGQCETTDGMGEVHRRLSGAGDFGFPACCNPKKQLIKLERSGDELLEAGPERLAFDG